jgi:iron complex outermembrane receptor protein
LQVARVDGHKWAISARGFNGQFSNKLLIMVDGRTVYTPIFSGSFWDTQDYVLQDIEKIEVVRGPGGTIWGANAVNGVINIITKNAIDTQGGYASITAGSQDRAIAEVRYGGRTESRNHYRIYAKQSYYDGLTNLNNGTSTQNGLKNEDGYKQSQAGFRYDIRSIQDSNISIHGDVRDGKADNYFQIAAANSPKPTHKYSKGANLVANWEKTISKKSSFNLQTYFDYDQFDTYILKRGAKTIDVDFQHFYNFSRNNQFIWGLGYRLIKDDIREKETSAGVVRLNYEPDKRNDEIFSAFIQDKIGLIADKLYLTIGSKFEHNDFTGFEYQPNAKLTYYPSRNQTVWVSVSRAIRTPTRGEAGLNLGPNIQLGANTYQSETVTAYELGYRIKPVRTVLIDIATFYNDYDNLRTFEVIDSVPTAANLGWGQSYGGEITAKWQVNSDWKLEAGYDFLKIDLGIKPYSTDSALTRLNLAEGQSPENQFRLRSNYNITPKVEFDNIFYYVDSLPLSGSTTGVNGVPSYTRLDTRIGYMLKENVDLSFGIQNITDNRHQEFGNALFSNKTEVGRTFYFKVALGL